MYLPYILSRHHAYSVYSKRWPSHPNPTPFLSIATLILRIALYNDLTRPEPVVHLCYTFSNS